MNTDMEQRESIQLKNRRVWRSLLSGFVLLVVWSGMVFAGYRYIDLRLQHDFDQTREEVRRRIQEVRETNALNVQELQQKILDLGDEMQDVRQAMEDTGQIINTSSSTTRQALDAKVRELDQRLKDLTQSLKILQEDQSATH